MELLQVNDDKLILPKQSSQEQFIEANTMPIDYKNLRDGCIIPVFAKDNESTISHPEFIDAVKEVANHAFTGQQLLSEVIVASHPIKGRIPGAMGKPAKQLLDHEKTIYYERMAFMIEIPSIQADVNGNKLSLTIGGVRAYNQENLYNRKSEERFKVFIGFKNLVCVNLCISTDGLQSEIKVRHTYELMEKVLELFTNFQYEEQLQQLTSLGEHTLTEQQFANLVGRARMYQFLPAKVKKTIPGLQLLDSQINSVVKEYYNSESFSRNRDGSISLWKLYNLYTGAAKSSYIDTFLERGANVSSFTNLIAESLKNSRNLWYLS